MKEKDREDQPCCYFHPKEANTVGVCPLCLNERLLILAAKQGTISTHSTARHRIKPSSITLPKIFALGSLLKSHDHQKQFDSTLTDASLSPEDSFISIKFEDNGVASWEKSKVSLHHCNNISWNHTLSKDTKEDKSVVEHAKPRGGSLRWRKRIGHLFQLSRWRRSTKGSSSVCQVGSSKLEGVKVRSGWIRTLTKRRTKE